MGFRVLEPEVAGGWGADTVANVTVHPPAVTRLHYQFDGWLGDDLLESFPCFIVTARLASRLKESRLTGFRLRDVKVTKSDQFEGLQGDVELPAFEWLQVVGAAGPDDFALSTDNRLVVSEQAFRLLSAFQLRHCRVAVWPG